MLFSQLHVYLQNLLIYTEAETDAGRKSGLREGSFLISRYSLELIAEEGDCLHTACSLLKYVSEF